MSSLINWLSNYLLHNGIISEADIPWFRYGIEKRITTILVMIPFVVLAVLFTNILVALSFFASFYFLRSRTNGYHANSFRMCFLNSLLIEILFLGVIYPLLNTTAVCVVAIMCTLFIFLLAPYNHPNMHLSQSEIIACRISSRIRTVVIVCAIIVADLLHVVEIAKGLSLGIAMATLLLCLAYLLKGGSQNEENSRNCEKKA